MIAPPPPPTVTERPEAFYDTECYPNYWLLKLKPRNGPVYSFRLNAGESFDAVTIERIRLLFEAYKVVSFNGLGYDVPMICSAMCGYTAEQLKWQNDRLIPAQVKGHLRVQGAKPWELGLPEWAPADHVDIMEVVPGAGSQKLFAGRIHYKTMRDLPYPVNTHLTDEQKANVDEYCENDLGQLEALYDAVKSMIAQREALGKRYGMDLRSKSDAQVAEAVLKRRCEQALGTRIYKPKIDWGFRFRYEAPGFIAYSNPDLIRALTIATTSDFGIKPPAAFGSEEKGKCVSMPEALEGLTITIGTSTYKIGIGGLHSQEKSVSHYSDAAGELEDIDVEAFYPSMMLNAGAWPEALGPAFLREYASIKDERVACKLLAKKLEKMGFEGTVEYIEAKTGDSGGKIMINGTFGKTGSPFSVLFAPKMLIQTTLTGQLVLLMLIEWLEHYGIRVVSANTDGIVTKCPPHLVETKRHLIAEWEKRTGLKMESTTYRSLHSRDINNYFAVKTDGSVKRKGEYAPASLIMKKSPDVEICSDAVAEYLAHGTPLAYTIAACRDIRKFVTIQNVAGGALKLWGESVRKGTKVADMVPVLLRNGWAKEGRKWRKGDMLDSASEAYESCFAPQRPEYLGKCVRWYYGTRAPGPIVYASNGNTVSLSYGAQPCMTLPDAFPDDIDFDWYIAKAEQILVDVGK